jgi:hypothetical protein
LDQAYNDGILDTPKLDADSGPFCKFVESTEFFVDLVWCVRVVILSLRPFVGEFSTVFAKGEDSKTSMPQRLATKPDDKFFLCRIPTRNLDNKWNHDNIAVASRRKRYGHKQQAVGKKASMGT